MFNPFSQDGFDEALTPEFSVEYQKLFDLHERLDDLTGLTVFTPEAELLIFGRPILSKLRENVSGMDRGAVGNGVDDDSISIGNVFATGKDINLLNNSYAVTGLVGLTDGQRISRGLLLKYGTELEALVRPAIGTDGLHFDGVKADGNASAFANGNPVSFLFGQIQTNLTMSFCHLRNIVDSGSKTPDSMGGLYLGNLLENMGENGFELYNYGTNYGSTPRALYEGGNRIAFNRIRVVTRYESPTGPIVDASCIALAGGPAHGHKLTAIIGNITEDTQHHIWLENNTPGSEADALAIIGNVGWTGLSGGTAQNIFGKAYLGLIGVKNAVAIGNVGRNIGNHLVDGTRTAFIKLAGQMPGNESLAGVNNGIVVALNAFEDDSGLAGRTQDGIHVDQGQRMIIVHNMLKGASQRQVHINGDLTGEDTPANVKDIACYANMGGEEDYSWHQPHEIVFTRTGIETTGTQEAFLNSFETEYLISCNCRVVALGVSLTSAVAAGEVTVVVEAYRETAPGVFAWVASTDMRIDFGPDDEESARAVVARASTAGTQLKRMDRLRVRTISLEATVGISGTFWVTIDKGMKR